MSVSRKAERELIRAQFLESISTFLHTNGEEVLRVKSNEIAIPVVGCEGNEDFLVITFKVPTGADKGLTPYDGYAMAEDYELSLKAKAEKAEANAKAKVKKVARDEEVRKRKAEISAKRDAQSLFQLLDVIRLTHSRGLVKKLTEKIFSNTT